MWMMPLHLHVNQKSDYDDDDDDDDDGIEFYIISVTQFQFGCIYVSQSIAVRQAVLC